MAEGDGPAVDIDAGGIEMERADDGQNLRGKGLVQFDEADVVERKAGMGESFGDGGDGADAHFFRQAAGDGIGGEAREGLKAEFACVCGFHEDGRCCAVGGLRGVAGGNRALRVEGGLELGECFGGGVGARAFVGGEDFSWTWGFPAFAPGTEVVTGTGTSSSLKRPAACAARAFWWLARANSSWSAREIP